MKGNVGGLISHVSAKRSRAIAIKVLLLLFLAGVWLGVIGFSTQHKLANATNAAIKLVAIKATLNDTHVRDKFDPEKDRIEAPVEHVYATYPLSENDTNKQRNRDRLVISIKTMPGRIRYIQPTLDSLLFGQTFEFDQLYLILPEQPKGSPDYEIPDFVHNYSQHGLVSMLRPIHDFGAIDKMLHTLPVEKSIYQQQSVLQTHQFRILYCDDDMIYDPLFVEVLATKSDQYPKDVVALSGGNLTSHFRQIGHSDPKKNQHPYLFYWVGGLDSHGDPVVDIVQGFMGVVVRLSFFNIPEFVRLAGNSSFPDGVRRLDDFVICGYLETYNVTRRCVDGGLKPKPNPTPATIGNLGKTMHRNAMIAASYLQREWGIWSQYTFEPYEQLSERVRNLIDCEARHTPYCSQEVLDAKGKPIFSKATKLLDDEFGINFD